MADRHKLNLYARGDLEVVMTRDFDAPRELVWDAWTNPELVRRWLIGPEGWVMTRCDIDLRVGGAYRYELTRTKPDEAAAKAFDWHAEVMGWGGVYKELDHPGRFVNTEQFDDPWYEGELVMTNVLTEQGGVTHFESTMRCVSNAAQQALLSSGMDEGIIIGFERLDEIFAEMAATAPARA